MVVGMVLSQSVPTFGMKPDNGVPFYTINRSLLSIRSILKGIITMKREKILIAEKSTFMRVMLTTALGKLGFEVLGTAKDGEDAVAKYRGLKPDIALVDIALDGIDGIEVTRRIVNEYPAAVVIMLIVDSLDIPDIIVEAVRAGAKGYMKKPISEEEIEKRISGALGRG